MEIYKFISLPAARLAVVPLLVSITASVIPVYLATTNFTGTLETIETNNGSSMYSGLVVGDTFTGVITNRNSASDAIQVHIEPAYVENDFGGTSYRGFLTEGSITTARSGNHESTLAN